MPSCRLPKSTATRSVLSARRWPANQTLFSSQVSIILGGYKDKIENDLYAADKGLRSRFIPFEFADYSDAELFRILKSKCEEDRCARALFTALTFAMNVRWGLTMLQIGDEG